ncbi:asparagine synthase-related protein [Nitrincola nitratireducens]|uniref:asparagine synthase (glutamine-hydrolyzing) n=2 Tax=Nitrincola TaxID=267849 RepID=W9V8I2_9GAMM|nr:asparagine synthase-related protein [Nitrincola nitratireducens]EXJ12357.1 Putative asparagine synthetase [Nitrincola nitratireducens]
MQTWLADDLLLKADRMLMVKGVEGRVPFLDHRLVLMGLSLPAQLKIQQRLGKQVPRAWLQQHQKAFNASGKKKGFSVPVTDWIQGLSRQKLASALLSSAIIQDVCQVQELTLRLQSSAPIDKSLAEALAVLLQLAVWSKLFLEGDGLAPPYSIDPLDWLLAT